MGQISAKLRRVRESNDSSGLGHYCPGCEGMHVITVEGKNSSGACWTWDGNAVAPTFAPSVHVRVNPPGDPNYQANACSSVCHYFLRAGSIEFLSDCTHKLKGQTVPLPDLPLPLTDRYLGTEPEAPASAPSSPPPSGAMASPATDQAGVSGSDDPDREEQEAREVRASVEGTDATHDRGADGAPSAEPFRWRFLSGGPG